MAQSGKRLTDEASDHDLRVVRSRPPRALVSAGSLLEFLTLLLPLHRLSLSLSFALKLTNKSLKKKYLTECSRVIVELKGKKGDLINKNEKGRTI